MLLSPPKRRRPTGLFNCCEEGYRTDDAGKETHRWTGEGGYREVLVIAVSLLLTTSSHAIQHFVDRMFLTWYSAETLAAAMPAVEIES